MTIKGFVETVDKSFISGWCIDDEVSAPLDVQIRVGSTCLGSVHADIPLRGNTHGAFRFPISAQLFRLLPHRAEVKVTANGQALPFVDGCSQRIDNPDEEDSGTLGQMLRDGYFISPKSGKILLPFKEQFEEDQVLDGLEECQKIFFELFSKRFFVCYGTLLGVVRDNDFIAHDDDVDVCFLADGDMDDALDEFHQVVAALRARGEKVHVADRGHFHWRELDVFVAWFEGDNFYLHNAGGRFSRSDLNPLTTRVFKGHEIVVPNNAEALLELIYGPGWKVPDPNFQWRLTPDVRRRMRLIDRDAVARYWKDFYNNSHTMIPSPFAVSVAVEWREPRQVLDIGCGNGRDAFFFASLGHHVLGVDSASTAIERNRSLARKRGVQGIDFEAADVSVPDILEKILAGVDGNPEGAANPPMAIYARFFLHAITAQEEDAIFRTLSAVLPSGTDCYFEFRTDRDESTPKRFGRHYRRYLNLERFVGKAVKSGSFDCLYRVEGQGMAKYREEDPFVGRVYLRRL